MSTSITLNPKIHLFETFTRYLEVKAISYVIVGDVRGYPESLGGDVDIVVSQADFKRVDKVLLEFGQEHGVDLVQVLRHEVNSSYYVISKRHGGERGYLALDMGSDYMRDAQVYLKAERFLAQRQKDERGFFIPEPRVGFIYYLLKKVLKNDVDKRQWNYLKEVYSADKAGAAEELRALWDESTSTRIVKSLESGKLTDFKVLMGDLEKQLPQRRLLLAEMGRILNRVRQPTGLWIAMFGPDGAGKSTVIEALETSLAPAFRRTRRRHLRPHLGKRSKASEGPVTDPHAAKARGSQTSLLKLVYWWADYTLGYWLQTLPVSIRSTLTVFDRYYHDLLVDPKRYRYGGPQSLAKLIGALVPKPKLSFVLDAPAEVLQARKQEVSFEETLRQRTAYSDLAERLPRAHIVNVDRDVAAITAEVEDIVIAHMVARTRRRLR